MRKIITLILLAILVVLPFITKAGNSEAVDYLKGQTPNEWITMGLVAGGETAVAKDYLKTFTGTSATDYAKRILAIVAVGENPRSFANTDLVAGLKAQAVSGQIGDISLLNDDAWGILALRAAGENSTDSVVAGAKNYLLNHQESDGGWGWQTNGASDTNDTAAVLMALGEVGVSYSNSAVQNGFNYLHTNQQTDGGFPYDLTWPTSDSGSTAWIISALNKFNRNSEDWKQGSATPISFLQSLQMGDGSYKWQAGDAAGLATMTAYALVALNNSSYPVRPPSSNGGGRRNSMVNIKLTVDLNANEFQSGDMAQLQINLINLGPDNAHEIDVVNILPASFQGVKFSLGQGYWQADKNQWILGNLAKDSSASLKFSFPVGEVAEKTVWSSQVRVITPSDDEFDQTDNQVNYTFTVIPKIIVGPAVVDNPPAPQVLGISTERCPSPTEQPLAQSELALNRRGQFLKTPGSQLVYYVTSSGDQVYCLDSDQTAQKLLSLVGLGINQSDLDKIPETGEDLSSHKFSLPLIAELSGRILLNIDQGGSAWYVDKKSFHRVYLGVFGYALETMRNLAIMVDNELLTTFVSVSVLSND